MRLVTDSPRETFELGVRIGKGLTAGAIICLSGELGAGKTALTQGIAKGLEVEDYITSPTYTIVNEYQGRLPLYHFDVYRLENEEELYEIGFDEYLERGGVIIIEWASIIEDALPHEHLWITIERGEGLDQRVLHFHSRGKLYEELLKELSP